MTALTPIQDRRAASLRRATAERFGTKATKITKITKGFVVFVGFVSFVPERDP